jgi:FkbH-like protein
VLDQNVKLVIWDLDDTFWAGTLSEGETTLIERNKDIVITLAKRGIVSSICSKNDPVATEAKLRALDVWDWFIFPRIEFGPKGQNIAQIIESANLRAENVLFIDDNVLNLNEAKHYAKGIMVADPAKILDRLLALPQLEGKNDTELSRLKQYKNLEKKVRDSKTTNLGNVEFLRQCDIRIAFDYDFETQVDRVVELANRSNQLNFTKSRFESPEAIEKLRESLNAYGAYFGTVQVRDNYGEYGMVGFYAGNRLGRRNVLDHFVFSCRAMNMGVEQYIYQRLFEPIIKVVEPVANPVKMFDDVDWITEGGAQEGVGRLLSSKKLLLIGGCELVGLSTFCSSRREEFTNTVRGGWDVRFDDPGFICGDIGKIKRSPAIAKLKYWTAEDVERLAAELPSSELVLTALFNALNWTYFETNENILVRIEKLTLNRHLKTDGMWFVSQFRRARLSLGKKLDLVRQSLDHLAAQAPPEAKHFSLGVITRKIPGVDEEGLAQWLSHFGHGVSLEEMIKGLNQIKADRTRDVAIRHIFNRYLKELSATRPNFFFVDVDALVPENALMKDSGTQGYDPSHFSRQGFLAIAEYINGIAAEASAPEHRTAMTVHQVPRVHQVPAVHQVPKVHEVPTLHEVTKQRRRQFRLQMGWLRKFVGWLLAGMKAP